MYDQHLQMSFQASVSIMSAVEPAGHTRPSPGFEKGIREYTISPGFIGCFLKMLEFKETSIKRGVRSVWSLGGRSLFYGLLFP